MSITQTFPFTTPSNYTYDSDLVEITGGVAKLKNQTPTDATCWATYTTDEDLNGSANGGVLTGTLNGGASVSGGYLDLTGGGSSYADYAGLNNVDTLVQEGAIRFILKPAYTGTPVAIRNFIVIAEASGDASNLVNLYHKSSDGNLKMVINDQVLGTIMSEDLGAWSPIAGTDYEFEINFIIDTAVGANTFIRLFIDGTQFGATKTGVTGTRSSNIGLIRLGTNVGTGDTADQSIKDIIFYDAIQHTSNYTSGYTLPESIYSTANPTVEINLTWGMEGLDGFTETSTITGSDAIQYYLKKGTIKNYYNSGWVVSDGTYSQSSSAADIETNKATYTTVKITFGVVIFLHSDDGSTTPEIDVLVIDYDYAGETPDTINTCIVWGFAKKINNTVASTAVSASLTKGTTKYKNYTSINSVVTSDTPNVSDGYWEIELIENENMESNVKYLFTIDGKSYIRTVPNETTKAFWDLI